MNKTSNEVNSFFEGKNVYPKHIVKKVFDNVSEGIVLTDDKANILIVNPSFEFVTGYQLNEVIGKNPSILQSGIHDDSFYHKMWSDLQQDGFWKGEIWNRRKNGEIYPEILTIFEIKSDEFDELYYCGIFSDLSERKSQESQIEKISSTDALTKVNNRFAYFNRMKILLDTSKHYSDIQHAVFFLDLDRFKQINDSLGHDIGDKVLISLSKRLRKLTKNKDLLARFGGDEFVITLTNIYHPREAANFAERIIQTIEEPINIDGQDIYISTSVGISIYPNDGSTTEELINRADKALYYTKQNGRSGFAFYFEELNSDNSRLLLLDSELRKAIEQKCFDVYFQPKLEVHTNQIIGLEALVRWHNEKLGYVSPNEFIPYSEDTGLIIPISEIIFEKVCGALLYLKQKGISSLPISINISSIHFQHNSFLKLIERMVERNNTSPHNIEFEVTERTMMNNDEESVNKLMRLKQLGFTISIDDFGTGYSSLSYLIRFPLDLIKIDRSFIQQLSMFNEKNSIVDAIIQMAHRLNMKVIAEGVETKEQLTLLKEMNCDYVQGYYICKPIPLEELPLFLQSWDSNQGRTRND